MSRAYKYCPRCAKPLEAYEDTGDGNRTRVRCPDKVCGFVHWDNPVPVVAAIVEHEGKVVLARNANWPPKMFGLVTGFLERDEAPEEGLIREVEEEIGLKAHTPTFIGHYPFKQMNQVIMAWHVLAEGPIKLGAEIVEVKRIAPEKIRPWPTGTGHAMRDWLKSKGINPEAGLISPLHAIYAFLPLGENFGTAGQPTPEQFPVIRDDGYQTVVNLAREDSLGALPDERQIVTGLGLQYVHISVDFAAPTAEDLRQFFAVLERNAGKRVFVHCAMNKRVSAFMFLYRVKILGVPVAEAELALHRMWDPDPVWQKFIDEMLRAEL